MIIFNCVLVWCLMVVWKWIVKNVILFLFIFILVLIVNLLIVLKSVLNIKG